MNISGHLNYIIVNFNCAINYRHTWLIGLKLKRPYRVGL